MSVLEIVKAPDPMLNRVCDPVDLGAHTFENRSKVADDLLDTVIDSRGRGLAAPQIGVPIRMIAMKHGSHFRILVNPVIVRRGRDITEGHEGCLSIPGRTVSVPRHKIVTVEWVSIHGMKFSEKLRGMDARCAQHEIDHLDGVLIPVPGVTV